MQPVKRIVSSIPSEEIAQSVEVRISFGAESGLILS